MNDPRRVLVTGGSRGIGFATAMHLVDTGHNVVVTSRDGKAPSGLLAVRCEMTDTASVDQAFTEAENLLGGNVELLVCNAGTTSDSLIVEMSDDEFDLVIETNLAGTFRCVRRASRGMIRRRFGRIILVSSVVGLRGSAGQANYASSKAGTIGLGRSIARELGGRGITVNIVAPGFVETAMTASLNQSVRDTYLAQIPTGRFAHPGEVASTIAFLASDHASYINGAVIPVDGGLGMGH